MELIQTDARVWERGFLLHHNQETRKLFCNVTWERENIRFVSKIFIRIALNVNTASVIEDPHRSD